MLIKKRNNIESNKITGLTHNNFDIRLTAWENLIEQLKLIRTESDLDQIKCYGEDIMAALGIDIRIVDKFERKNHESM